MKSVSKCVGNAQMESFELAKDKVESIPNFNEFTINVKAKTSKLFFDAKGEEEEEEDYSRRCFKWHCEVIKFLFFDSCRLLKKILCLILR